MFWPSCQSERSNRVICLLPVSWGGESKPSSNEGGAGWATYIRLARLALSAPLSYCPRAVPSHFKRAAALSKLVREARPGLAHFSESEWREVTLADIVLGLHRSGGVSAAVPLGVPRPRESRHSFGHTPEAISQLALLVFLHPWYSSA